MRGTSWDRAGRPALAALALLQGLAASASEQPPPAVAAATLARAAAIRTLPCTGDATVEGFAPETGAPPVWLVAGARVSVRRRGDDRLAFVLAPPMPGATDCAVRQILALPSRGTMLDCSLPDHSSPGLGVHTRLASGRRDLVFWRGDGVGGLRRSDLDAGGLDDDALICALPDAMP